MYSGKSVFILFLCCWISWLAQGQKNASPKNRVISKVIQADVIPRLTVDSLRHSFGTIPQGKPVECWFMLTNTGKSEIILNDINAPCGCTTPVWEKGLRLPPGKRTPVRVIYDAARTGPFEKRLTVYYNDGYFKDLFILGEVLAHPD